MTEVVLDASAVLAVLLGEPGADRVAPHLNRAILSAVNYSEVLAKAARLGGSVAAAQRHVDRHPFRVIPFDAELAGLAAVLVPGTRAAGLSLGDRACLALGLHRGCEVLTADRAWAALDLAVPVTCIR